MTSKEKLKEIELERDNFIKDNKDIVDKLKYYDNRVRDIKNMIKAEKILNKPKFFSDFNVNDFRSFIVNIDQWDEDEEYTIDQEFVNNFIKNVELFEYDDFDMSQLIGWKYIFTDESYKTNHDWDYYTETLTVISPDNYKYTTSTETCFAQDTVYKDKLQ